MSDHFSIFLYKNIAGHSQGVEFHGQKRRPKPEKTGGVRPPGHPCVLSVYLCKLNRYDAQCARTAGMLEFRVSARRLRRSGPFGQVATGLLGGRPFPHPAWVAIRLPVFRVCHRRAVRVVVFIHSSFLRRKGSEFPSQSDHSPFLCVPSPTVWADRES